MAGPNGRNKGEGERKRERIAPARYKKLPEEEIGEGREKEGKKQRKPKQDGRNKSNEKGKNCGYKKNDQTT